MDGKQAEKKRSLQKLDFCTDDGLFLPESRPWAEEKHLKICYYFQLFATSMKKKWANRVYIDLFSSAGKTKIRETDKIVPGSPFLALNIEDKFDRYVFVEKDEQSFQALKLRVNSNFPSENCVFINGDCNIEIQRIISSVPKFNRDNKGLSLCFADPYNTSQLSFSTIERIASSLYVDFLILIPTYMDINRNEHQYTVSNNHTLDSFLGSTKWRDEWKKPTKQYEVFGLFVADYFCRQMKSLGYLYNSLADMELITMRINQNLPLYHIAFFSKHPLGMKFWKETKKNTTDQFSFCFE